MFFENGIQIKKRTLPAWAALLLLFLPLIYNFFTELFGLPNAIKFVSDFLILLSFIVIALNNSSRGVLFVHRVVALQTLLVVLFILYTLILYVLKYQSAFYYIWGIRNNFRFYFAFFIFVIFMSADDGHRSLKIFDYAFWINFVVALFQYFVLGFAQDYLGGIFGVQKGCNGYVLVLISLVIVKSLLSYMNGNEKTFSCMSKCCAALLLAALSELKVFFLVFVLILSLSAVLTRFSARKFLLLFVSFLLLIVAYTILITIFENFTGFLSFDYLVGELFKENYASKEDMGRFTSISTICDKFLTTVWSRIFGMGLGNCDTSQISFFNTPFYERFAQTHYSIFSISFMFIETGFIGLAFFILFFVFCFIRSNKALKNKEGDLLFNQIGVIIPLLCLILVFYNSSLRTEAGYIIYFALALPYIGLKQVYEHRRGNI